MVAYFFPAMPADMLYDLAMSGSGLLATLLIVKVMLKTTPILLFAVLATPSWAALKSIDQAAVAMSLDQNCRWVASGLQDCEDSWELRILGSSGRDHGTWPISFAADSKLDILEAYTLQPDGKRIEVSNKDRQAGDVPGENGFVGEKFIRLAFPEVQVGSRLVLRTREQRQPVKPFDAHSAVFRVKAMPGLWQHYSLRIQSDDKLHWRAANAEGMFEVKQSADGKSLQLALKQPVYRETTESDRRFKLRQLPRIEVSTAADARQYLAPMGKAIARLQGEALPPKALEAVNKVRDLPPQRQLALLLGDVKKRIRYMGDWRLTVNGFVPFSLAEIEQRGFGDCKDMALTLTAMMRAVGLDASVSIVRADLDNSPMLLSPLNHFNHAIVHIRLDGKDYWLDPTAIVNAWGSVPDTLRERQTMLIAPDGEIRESYIAGHDSEALAGSQSLDFHPDGEGKWRVSAKAQADWVESVYYQSQMYAKGSVQEIAKDLLYPGMTLLKESLVLPQGQRLLFEPQTLSAELSVENVTREVGGFRLLDLSTGQAFIKRMRDYQQKEGVSDYRDSVGSYSWLSRVHGVKPLAPLQACKVSSKWRDFEIEPVMVEGGVGVRQKSVRKLFWIPAADVASPAFRKMIDELDKCSRHAQILLSP